ncbi:MAG: Mut7-C RNAse domain-containing protein [candidate division KSB1 bacterium]|nr:Mut7-C RNAse domain-containing protein [candidate division KSB1 bacterium]
MKFAVDVMLGKLAKWLRIIGYDTEYGTAWTDAELRAKATRERRMVLTRDRALAESLGPNAGLFIESQNPREQFRQVVETLGLDTEQRLFTICTLCNREVEPVDPREVEHELAEYVRQQQRSFWRCPACGRLYWEGSHIVNAKGWIAASLEKKSAKRTGDS